MKDNLPVKSEFLIYRADDGEVKLEVRLEDETLWLTQQMMADLFQTSKQNIGQHLKNIFAEGELSGDSVVKNFFTTASDDKQYKTNFYNLDAIISVGYRVKSIIQNKLHFAATGMTAAEIIRCRARAVLPNMGLTNTVILNQDLIKGSTRHIDYVIIHELCHIAHSQHNQTFYTLLKSKLPQWEVLKTELELRLLG